MSKLEFRNRARLLTETLRGRSGNTGGGKASSSHPSATPNTSGPSRLLSKGIVQRAVPGVRVAVGALSRRRHETPPGQEKGGWLADWCTNLKDLFVVLRRFSSRRDARKSADGEPAEIHSSEQPMRPGQWLGDRDRSAANGRTLPLPVSSQGATSWWPGAAVLLPATFLDILAGYFPAAAPSVRSVSPTRRDTKCLRCRR